MTDKTVVLIPGTVLPPVHGALAACATRLDVAGALHDIDMVGVGFGCRPLAPYLFGTGPDLPDLRPEEVYLTLLGYSLAGWKSVRSQGVEPQAFVGQSVGELWSMVAAGMISATDGARLACLRSSCLTAEGWKGSMTAVTAGADAVRGLISAVDHPDLALAGVNAPQRSVVSGPEEALTVIERLFSSLGWNHARIDVPHATHSPGVAGAARAFLATAPVVRTHAPRYPVYSPTARRFLGAGDDPVELVTAALTLPVLLHDALLTLHCRGVVGFVECGEAEVASKFVRESLTGAAVRLALEPSKSDTDKGRSKEAEAPVHASSGPQVRQPAVRQDPPTAVADAQAAVSTEPAPPPKRPTGAEEDSPSASGGAEPASQPPEPDQGAANDREGILKQLRELYAQELEYPEELLEEDAALEAELGVESLRQMRLLAKMQEVLLPGAPPVRLRLADHQTIGQIADFVVAARA
ncbi:acyltransferase domain-containing protein [Streptomyces sp. NPDC087300]|uniref:acyltransferase domain-containing protein n=1 Tax=Streptomyces sp. NPDC087300 TaxID=3365780 RepID=UPI00380D7045